MYIFLDESGDLGFDFTKYGTSKFFIMTVLVSKSANAIRAINLAARKALDKTNYGKKKNFNNELKGSEIPLKIKRYFLDRINADDWCLYSVVIDKKTFCRPKYLNHTNHVYNYIAAHLLNEVVVDDSQSEIIISVDKCKMAQEICEFNRYIGEVFCSKLSNVSNLVINHCRSHDIKSLQAVDLFCSGLFAKYEHSELSWYSCFENKICVESKL